MCREHHNTHAWIAPSLTPLLSPMANRRPGCPISRAKLRHVAAYRPACSRPRGGQGRQRGAGCRLLLPWTAESRQGRCFHRTGKPGLPPRILLLQGKSSTQPCAACSASRVLCNGSPRGGCRVWVLPRGAKPYLTLGSLLLAWRHVTQCGLARSWDGHRRDRPPLPEAHSQGAGGPRTEPTDHPEERTAGGGGSGGPAAKPAAGAC